MSGGKRDGADELHRWRVREALQVTPGKRARLDRRDTNWDGGEDFEGLSGKKLNSAAKRVLAEIGKLVMRRVVKARAT